jgi:long-chain acyl-CoA synthetase
MSLLQRLRLARDSSITVANLVDELLRRQGDRTVSIEQFGPRTLAQLHTEVCAIDSFLRRTVQLAPGQPVAIYRTNDVQCFHWFLGIVRAGGIAVPLNPQLTVAEVRRILASSGTQILVTDRAVFERNIRDVQALEVSTWIQADPQPETLEGFLRGPGDDAWRAKPSHDSRQSPLPPAVVDPSDTVAIFHTSGTSGFPKGAALSSRALLGARSSTVIAGLVLGSRDLALVALPWSHIMAVSIALYGLMAGIPGCFLDRFDASRAVDMIETHRVTAVVGVPAMFTRLVNSNPDPARLKTVRLWLSASDHLPSEVRERLRQFGQLLRLPFGRRFPPVLINGYGMVELGGLAMMGVDLSFAPGSGDVCFPVPPFRIRVADEAGHSVPAGVTGECQILRRGVRPHYWNDQEKTPDRALLTDDGWLRTGDLATRNRLGMIRLVGRMKDVIKSGGYSVYVRELEEAVSSHPAVARAAAFGLPHPDKGEIPAAAVELHPNFAASESELVDWCRSRLAPYKAPRRIWVLEAGGLPQNHTGKLLRRELRERFSGQLDDRSVPAATSAS